MKKIMLLFFAILLVPFVLAEEPELINAEPELFEPGITPENCKDIGHIAEACAEGEETVGSVSETEVCCVAEPKLPDIKPGLGFKFGNFFDNVKLAFTFNKAKKAELGLAMAEKRLAIFKGYLESENEEMAEKAAKNYNKSIQKVEGWVEKIKGGEKQLKRIASLEEKLELHNAKVENLKAGIMQRWEEQNKTNINHSKQVFNQIAERNRELTQKIIAQKTQAWKRYKKQVSLTEEEAALEQNLVENRLNKAKALREHLKIAKQARKIRAQEYPAEESQEEMEKQTKEESEEQRKKRYEPN